MAASATLALKAGVWFRRGLLLMISPVRGYHRRYQAETPLIGLFKFASPALSTKILKTTDAFRVWRHEGPHPFIPKRPPTFVLAPESLAVAGASKNRLSRDSPGRSIFDFCNNICQKQT